MPDQTPSLFERVEALTAAGRIGEAYALLAGPETATDPERLLCLANWRLDGRFIHRNLETARNLFGHAARLGSGEGLAAYTAFVAGGVGGPADWPLAHALLGAHAKGDPDVEGELALVDAMELTPDGAPARIPTEEILRESPRISCVRGLFSAAECNFLMAGARPRLGPSTIIHPQTGRQVPDPIRTSEAMAFPFVYESPAIHALNRRIAAVTGTEAAQGEPLHILRYLPGQEYKSHMDALGGVANQRILTVLVYLNEDYEGGETRFDRADLTFRGAPGDALIFRNIDADGEADPLTRHSGLPVLSGEKYLASRWIRARPFLLPPPRPILDA